ncbi:dienelactone hydrolase family protein [Azomonas macrocytogenes]|uniref:Dienelactone hydrolase n=1 Tax=Azomonas macrocytogenes TaxID=69962 RepID=A0A839T925_AZOMA|nr:dienelactone hydrolase family protein [Azomonas macrocytogenes]MBB3104966.1 dienelactone hydrolase [Azomonas macrocytogenes]
MRQALSGLLLTCSTLAAADIQTREIPYTAEDGTTMVGYHAYDDTIQGPRPGIIVVHEFWGLNDHARERAREMAKLGYSTLAIDMYGEGKVAEHPQDAKAFMQAALQNAETTRSRFMAGMELLQRQPQTDPRRIGAAGYCFGGRVVLEMARQGVPLAGVVSFHGALVTRNPATPGAVKARVLVEHGAADSMVTADDVAAISAEMVKAGVDYQLVSHPGAKHAFTNPAADENSKKGLDVAYNKRADERSWADMTLFFKRTFDD